MFRELKTFSVLLLISALSIQAETNAVSVEVPVDATTIKSEPYVVNLAFVVERVSEFNPRVLFQREDIVRALQRSYQQRAAFLPQISLFASQTRQQIARGFGGSSLDIAPYNSFSGGVEGRLSVLDTDVYANHRIAKLEHLIAEADYKVAYQDILQQTVQTYFTVLRDMRSVEIVEGNIIREEDLLALAEDQFENGVATKIDVTRAAVRVASQRRSLMVATTLLEDSMLQLRTLLDLELDTELLIDRGIIEGIKAPPEISRYMTMEALLENRPELYSQKKQLEQAVLAEKAASWQRLPKLDIFGQWGLESEEAFDEDKDKAWLVGIEASMPLFEGGRIAAQKREAKAAVRQFSYLMRELTLQIEREFKFAIIDMQSRFEQIEIAGDEIRLGQDEVELALERYREGLADNRELIDAQQNLANAQLSHLDAIYLYGLSRLAFARAIGSVERVDE